MRNIRKSALLPCGFKISPHSSPTSLSALSQGMLRATRQEDVSNRCRRGPWGTFTAPGFVTRGAEQCSVGTNQKDLYTTITFDSVVAYHMYVLQAPAGLVRFVTHLTSPHQLIVEIEARDV